MKPATYCKNCGAYIPDGKKKCLACGFPVDVPPLYMEGDENKVEVCAFPFKPIDSYTEQRLFEYKGYIVNEYGDVLAVPEDVFESYMKGELFH